jgi:glycerol-3-phosphate dehydrogenase subunit C
MTFAARAKREEVAVNRAAPAAASGRKAALYATCFVNYNNPSIGIATRRVLAHLGVETQVAYPRCCGMPQLEHGELDKVAANARAVAEQLEPLIDQGHDIVALVPSCALMLKFEWPLIVPDDPRVKKLADATFDIAEYVVDIAKRHGLAPGLKPLDGGVTLHLACHARAQNMGAKAAEMLRLIPSADVAVIERCSGHGGSWGVMKANFETAIKVGRPVARTAAKNATRHLASECPLAGEHIVQGIERLDSDGKPAIDHSHHPIELFASAYGLM